MITRTLLAAAIAVLLVSAAPAADRGPGLTIRLLPAAPVKGTAAWVLVSRPSSGGDSAASDWALEGEAAGEPLHLRATKGGWAALAAAPLEGPDSLHVAVVLTRDGLPDTIRASFPLVASAPPAERLRVAPAMATFDPQTTARIERELAQSRSLSAGAHGTARLWRAFRVPRGTRITSVFGTPREYNGRTFSRHLGTDFAGAVGAPVGASARGVVALVADFYLAGRAVYLDHGGGLITGYFHLSGVDVAQGDTVSPGQLIGRVGRTGRVTGPHLHWIARYGGITIDPMSLVRLPPEP